jgi:hypothetical protein
MQHRWGRCHLGQSSEPMRLHSRPGTSRSGRRRMEARTAAAGVAPALVLEAEAELASVLAVAIEAGTEAALGVGAGLAAEHASGPADAAGPAPEVRGSRFAAAAAAVGGRGTHAAGSHVGILEVADPEHEVPE